MKTMIRVACHSLFSAFVCLGIYDEHGTTYHLPATIFLTLLLEMARSLDRIACRSAL